MEPREPMPPGFDQPNDAVVFQRYMDLKYPIPCPDRPPDGIAPARGTGGTAGTDEFTNAVIGKL